MVPTLLRHPIAEVRARRATLDRLSQLDAETDNHEMSRLVIGRVFADPVFLGAVFTVAYWRQVAVPPIARIIARRGYGDTLAQTRKRFDDTLLFFGFIYQDGWESGPGGMTIDRLAAIHERFSIRADDFRYTAATLCFEPTRLGEHFRVRGLTDHEGRAMFLFWRDVSNRWGIDIPEDQEGFRAWFEQYETDQYGYTEEAAEIAVTFGNTFCDRFFPGPLRPVGWWVLRAMADGPLLAAVGQPPAPAAARHAIRLGIATYIKGRRLLPASGQDRLLGPWAKAYPAPPTAREVGPDWAAGISAADRRSAVAGRRR